MKYLEALQIAEKYKNKLKPYCERIEIAGSIRRKKSEVGDIEIVCIPKTVKQPHGLFENKRVRVMGFITTVNQWEKIKGDPVGGRYTQRLLPEGIKLDIFMVRPENWGLIFAMRIGSEEFSHKVLANGWVRSGYHSKGGMLRDKFGKEKPIYEERELFELINIPYIEPEKRSL